MRACIIYDCLYPYTIGGAERWYRNLAELLAELGHEVTYVTRRQWSGREDPSLPGVRVVPVSPGGDLYEPDGRRRIGPPLQFGAGVLRHLAGSGARYDVVHTASFPYFSLLAAALVRRPRGFRLFVDWHEVWTRSYWHEYLGAAKGRAGWEVQRACLRIPQRAFCFSRLHERRLRDSGLGDVTRLEGQYAGSPEPAEPAVAEPVVVFAGRLIPEKNAAALVTALALAHERIPDLRLEIYGSGPERPRILESIERGGLGAVASLPGFVGEEALEHAVARALCLVLPSRREGYGLVVVEACAKGVPVVVARAPDNAAIELVEEGVNGTIAASTSPRDLADAIIRVHDSAEPLRQTTSGWFRQNAERLSLDSSLEQVLRRYADDG